MSLSKLVNYNDSDWTQKTFARSGAMRGGRYVIDFVHAFPRFHWRVLNVQGSRRAAALRKSASKIKDFVALRYPLQAWTEGHYACDCGRPQSANPYEQDRVMGEAWLAGWHCRHRLPVHRW